MVWEAGGPLGTNCLIADVEALQQAYTLCNRYGLDTISTGGVVSFAMECFKKGLLTKDDTDGIELTWGNHEAMLEVVRKIGEREGFGKLLGEGVKRAAERIGGNAFWTGTTDCLSSLSFPVSKSCLHLAQSQPMTGYFSSDAVKNLIARGIDVYVPPDKMSRRTALPPAPRGRIPKDLSIVDRMRRKLRTKKGKERYGLRKELPEPVFGRIKQARGFRQFLLRGEDKANGEWKIICAGHNLLKLFGAHQNGLLSQRALAIILAQ